MEIPAASAAFQTPLLLTISGAPKKLVFTPATDFTGLACVPDKSIVTLCWELELHALPVSPRDRKSTIHVTVKMRFFLHASPDLNEARFLIRQPVRISTLWTSFRLLS